MQKKAVAEEWEFVEVILVCNVMDNLLSPMGHFSGSIVTLKVKFLFLYINRPLHVVYNSCVKHSYYNLLVDRLTKGFCND